MSIKLKILIPMIITAVLVAMAILISNIMLFSKFIDSSLNKELHKMVSVVRGEIEITESQSRVAALYFSSDREIMNAMESGNNNALLSRASQLYTETGVEILTVTDTSGRVLARAHAPEIYGDDVSVMHSIREAQSGNTFTTIEYNMFKDMMACSGAPVLNDKGQLVGVIIAGFHLDTEKFVDRQRKITGCEISVYRRDVRVATTLQNEDGTRAVGMNLPDNISSTVLEGNSYSSQRKVLNKEMLTVYTPIKNSYGEVIGILFTGYHLSEKTHAVWSFIKEESLITIIFLGISSLFLLVLGKFFFSPIMKIIDKINYDASTGIYNRRYFDENLSQVMKSMSRSNDPLSMMMIDVDFFKNYNDTYGHSKGDSCLKTVAKVLTQSLTRTGDFVARYGGDEFAVVMPNTGESGARSIADELLENVKNCNILHESSEIAPRVTISIGITTGKVDHTQTGDDYIRRADKMLYKSKQEGRNRYNFIEL
jgi:diguanylate cyclase (GGDEF)-like protein